jgi:hypothetical protein
LSHDDVINDCAFSRDGRYLVTSSDDWTARLRSVPDLSLKAVLAGHGDDVTMSVFHPVEELIATVSRDYLVRVYDFDARLVSKFGGSASHVVWLDWTEDGRHLVALNDDGAIAITRGGSLTAFGDLARCRHRRAASAVRQRIPISRVGQVTDRNSRRRNHEVQPVAQRNPRIMRCRVHLRYDPSVSHLGRRACRDGHDAVRGGTAPVPSAIR